MLSDALSARQDWAVDRLLFGPLVLSFGRPVGPFFVCFHQSARVAVGLRAHRDRALAVQFVCCAVAAAHGAAALRCHGARRLQPASGRPAQRERQTDRGQRAVDQRHTHIHDQHRSMQHTAARWTAMHSGSGRAQIWTAAMDCSATDPLILRSLLCPSERDAPPPPSAVDDRSAAADAAGRHTAVSRARGRAGEAANGPTGCTQSADKALALSIPFDPVSIRFVALPHDRIDAQNRVRVCVRTRSSFSQCCGLLMCRSPTAAAVVCLHSANRTPAAHLAASSPIIHRSASSVFRRGN